MTWRPLPRTQFRAALPTALLLALAAVAPLCLAQPRLPVTDVRSLLLAAHDAPGGAASGVLTGPSAEAISQRFGTTAPILVDVRTLHPLAQGGCRRLEVRIAQDGVQLPGTAAPRRQVMEFGVDHCRDGLPPRRASPSLPASPSGALPQRGKP